MEDFPFIQARKDRFWGAFGGFGKCRQTRGQRGAAFKVCYEQSDMRVPGTRWGGRSPLPVARALFLVHFDSKRLIMHGPQRMI